MIATLLCRYLPRSAHVKIWLPGTAQPRASPLYSVAPSEMLSRSQPRAAPSEMPSRFLASSRLRTHRSTEGRPIHSTKQLTASFAPCSLAQLPMGKTLGGEMWRLTPPAATRAIAALTMPVALALVMLVSGARRIVIAHRASARGGSKHRAVRHASARGVARAKLAVVRVLWGCLFKRKSSQQCRGVEMVASVIEWRGGFPLTPPRAPPLPTPSQ